MDKNYCTMLTQNVKAFLWIEPWNPQFIGNWDLRYHNCSKSLRDLNQVMIRPNMEEVVVSLVHLFFNKTTKVLLFSAPSICRSKSSHSDLELEKRYNIKRKKALVKKKWDGINFWSKNHVRTLMMDLFLLWGVNNEQKINFVYCFVLCSISMKKINM